MTTAKVPYNDFFESELDARWFWLVRCLALDRNDSFPGDRKVVGIRRHGSTQGNSIFSRVKSAVTVESLAGRFTTLRRTGSGRLAGLCPLHDDKSPSFSVDPERQSWRCFGACGTGGDVISLAQALIDGELLV